MTAGIHHTPMTPTSHGLEPDSLKTALLTWIERSPSATGFRVDSRNCDDSVTRAEFGGLVGGTADRLSDEGVRRGDRVVVTRTKPLDFAIVFWALQELGAIAVPAPPVSGREGLRARSIIAGCRPRLVDSGGDETGELEVPTSSFDVWSVPSRELDGPSVAGADSIGAIQFTSGSVLSPRGCVLSHGAIVRNMRAAAARYGVEGGEVVVSWAPAYHDMGLFGGVVWPVVAGTPMVLLPTAEVVLRPVRWLKAIAEHRAVATAAPSFVLHLITRHLERRPLDVDLSSLREIIIGAERIDPEMVRAFLAATAPMGLADTCIHAAWGLAESVVIATSRRGGLRAERLDRRALEARDEARPEQLDQSEQDHSVEIACVGTPVDGLEVRVALADGQACPDGTVGDVLLRGDALLTGYWRDGHVDPVGEWLRTGDRGYLREGELFIVGRADELVVVSGRNVVPQDVEAIVERNVAGVRRGAVAAFGYGSDGSERVVIAVEGAGHEADRLRADCVRVCARLLDLAVHDVVVIRRGALPRTSSGKVQRVRLRREYASSSGPGRASSGVHEGSFIPDDSMRRRT